MSLKILEILENLEMSDPMKKCVSLFIVLLFLFFNQQIYCEDWGYDVLQFQGGSGYGGTNFTRLTSADATPIIYRLIKQTNPTTPGTSWHKMNDNGNWGKQWGEYTGITLTPNNDIQYSEIIDAGGDSWGWGAPQNINIDIENGKSYIFKVYNGTSAYIGGPGNDVCAFAVIEINHQSPLVQFGTPSTSRSGDILYLKGNNTSAENSGSNEQMIWQWTSDTWTTKHFIVDENIATGESAAINLNAAGAPQEGETINWLGATSVGLTTTTAAESTKSVMKFDAWAIYQSSVATYYITDEDTTPPTLKATYSPNPYYDTNFVITLNLVDSNSVSLYRSHAYFSWTANPDASNKFYDTTGINISGDSFTFTCPYNVSNNNFGDSIYKTLYWKVIYADSDADGTRGDADSSTATTSGTVTIQPPPTVATLPEANLTSTSVTLNCTYTIGEYASVQVFFNYKLKTAANWDTTVPVTKSSDGSFDTLVTNLIPDTVYVFRAAVRYHNGDSTSFGDTREFTTPALGEPLVYTIAATDTRMHQATLNCTFTVAIYDTVSIYFLYKKSTDTIWIATSYIVKDTDGSCSTTLTNLTSGKQYDFRAVVLFNNNTDSNTGNILNFTTVAETPTVTTQTNLTPTDVSVYLRGSLDINDYSSVYIYFKYRRLWTQINWDTTPLINKTTSGDFSQEITGLTPDTYYVYYAVVQYNTSDTNYGDTITFQTAKEIPGCTTTAATGIDTVYATLNGTYNFGNYSSLNLYFQYKPLNSSIWLSTAETVKTSGSSYDTQVTALLVNTYYEFRFVIKYDNGIYTIYGDTLVFKTKKANSLSINIVGSFPGSNWAFNDTTAFYTTNCPPGRGKNMIQVAVDDTFKIVQGNDWSGGNATQWSANYWITDYDTTVWVIPRNDQGNDSNARFRPGSVSSPSLSKFLTITSYTSLSSTSETFGFMLTSAPPADITAVSHNTSETLWSSNPVWVNITLSNAPPTEQKIYIRYTYNNWTSSYLTQSSGSGTSWTAQIPALGIAANFQYYVVSSTADLSTISSATGSVSNADILFLNINNNNSSNYSFTTYTPVPTPDTNVIAFTPAIDGNKDPLWGDTPSAKSDASAYPYNFRGEDNWLIPLAGTARGVYITNDNKYLYIGFEASGAHRKIGGIEFAADYAFIFFTTFAATGPKYDPWRATTITTDSPVDVWINGYILYATSAFGGLTRYVKNGTNWDSGTVVTNDAVITVYNYTQPWGELRIPLSVLKSNITVGDTIGFILGSRYQGKNDANTADKPGFNDMTPYQAGATSNWADGSAALSYKLAEYYIIQNYKLNASHIPDTELVSGKAIMRNPLSPASNESVKLTAAVAPTNLISSIYIYYTINNWVTTDSKVMTKAYSSGASEYYEVLLPSYSKNTTVKYYFKIPEQIPNYIYGDTSHSYVTTTEATAKSNAYSYTVKNSAPSAPSAAILTPYTPNDNHNLTTTAFGSTDIDNDGLIYKFDWYKNDTFDYTSYDSDSTGGYFSTISSFNTSQGENWYCNVSVGDGQNTSAIVKSNVIRISQYVNWSGTMPIEVNTANISDSEWIWLDKSNDERTYPNYPQNFDIQAVWFKMDTEYLNCRISFQDLTNINLPCISLAIDTDNSSNNNSFEIGDQSSVYYGKNYYDSATPDVQILIHSTALDQYPSIELMKAASSWSDVSADSYSTYIDTDANILEFRIRRSALSLSSSATMNCRLVCFKNMVGSASLIDATANFPNNDALDAISVNEQLNKNLNYNDLNNSNNAYYEDLFDSKIDFYFSLRYNSNGILSNNVPVKPSTPSPADGASSSALPLTLSWTGSTDADAGDTVTSYLLELNNSSNLSGNVLYRVNLSGDSRSFTIPSTLEGEKTYYWRVRARDKTGSLSDSTIWNFYYQGPPTITINQPLDMNNLDNYNRVQGDQSADSNINWYWAPATHSVGWKIKDYNIQIFTNATDTSTLVFSDTITGDAINGCTNSYTISYSNRLKLVRGLTYYAKIRAGDTATPQNWSSLSSASDGILYCGKKIDGMITDWHSDTGFSYNTIYYFDTQAGIPYYEVIWQDSVTDQRTDKPTEAANLDLDEFHISIDKYNMYFWTKFTNYYDGRPYIQIAIDLNDNSKQRYFAGRNVSGEDVVVSSAAGWNYLIRSVSGNDYVRIDDVDFNLVGYGKYIDSDNGPEFCVSLADIGGSTFFDGDTIKISVGIYWNDNNSVGDWTPTSSDAVNIVDCISNKATWSGLGNDEFGWSDKTLDYYIALKTDANFHFVSALGCTAAYTAGPPLATGYASGSRDYTFYNVFVDRFWNGDPNNQPSDPDMTGGDFEGLIKKMQYFNEMGITGLYLSPIFDFGGGVWGYNQSDLHKVQWSFTGNSNYWKYQGWDDFTKLAKECRHHNMKLGLDWIPGQIYGDNNSGGTISRNPLMWYGERFGGRRILQYVSNVRQFFVDHSQFLYSLGASFFRVDNPKFYPDPLEQGLPFFCYTRAYCDKFAPDLYTFGEVPGGPNEMSPFCKDGNRLHGMLDFDLRWRIQSWCSGGANSTIEDYLAAMTSNYGNAVMTGFYENHDHDRNWSYVGNSWTWSPWNTQKMFLYLAAHTGPPVIFYGDERCMYGLKNTTFPDGTYTESTSKFGNTRAFPWNSWENPPSNWPAFAGATNDIQWTIQKAMMAREIFDPMRWDVNATYIRHWGDPYFLINRGSGDITSQEVIVCINKSSGSLTFNNIPSMAGGAASGTVFRDWFTAVDGGDGRYTADGSGNISGVTLGANYAAYLVRGSFGLAKLYIRVLDNVGQPVKGAIVSVDNKSSWTRETGEDGYVFINYITTADYSSTNRWLKIFKKGFMTYNAQVTFTDGYQYGDGVGERDKTLTIDDHIAPAAPTGLRAISRGKGCELYWGDNTESDFESYYVYRSKTTTLPSSADYIIEVLKPMYIDYDFDRGLTLNDTYYYWVRARDINDNVSSPSNMVTVVPRKVSVTFQVDMSGSEFTSIEHIYIKCNAWELGRNDFNASYKMPDIDPLNELTNLGRGIYEKTVDMDPTMTVNYMFVCQHDGGQWFDEYGFTTSNPVTYENARDVKILDSTDHKFAVVKKWMVWGDVAPQTPISLTAIGKNQSIKVGWSLNKEADMENYELWRSVGSDNNYGSTAYAYIEKSQITFTDYNVTNGTTYYYRLKAVDKNGYASDSSTAVSAIPTSAADTTPPAAPTGLSAVGYGLNTVKLSWNYNTEGDFAGYNVYRATQSNFSDSTKVNNSLISPSFTPAYYDTGVQNAITYYYAVTALDDLLNESVKSTACTVKLARITFKVDMGSFNYSNVQFTSDASYIGWSPGAEMTLDTGTIYIYTTDFVCSSAIQYKYAYNGATILEGDFNTGSKKRELTIPDVASYTYTDDWENYPDKINDLRGQPDSGAAWLFWTANTTNEDLKGYNVYKQNSDQTYTKINIDVITDNYYKVTGLTNGTAYTFTARCIDSGNMELESENSNLVQVTPNKVVWVHFRN